LRERGEEVYDCAVIGAGPAGLSAALYMGRMRRSVVVVDDNEGRSNWHQTNRNYLGFPDGIHARALREVGREQAERYDVRFLDACVSDARVEGEGPERRFYLDTSAGKVVARTLIFATGVSDEFPDFDGCDDCIGKSLFWCIICDGYEAIGKKIVVLGSGDRATALALQLLVFTDRVSLVPWKKPLRAGPERVVSMREHGVTIYDSQVRSFNCAPHGQLASLTLEDDTQVDLDSLFVTQWIKPNTQLAQKLDIRIDEHGFIVVDVEGSTTVDGAYAAGDVTKLFNHQISSAVHEGGMAAAAANYYLYEEWQKE
jgi:thioredoxin reductase (NADPH)